MQGGKKEKKPVYKTRNLSLAAYLYMNGLELLSGRRSPERGNYELQFVFNDPNNQGETISKQFPLSESSRHDECVRFLKNFLNDSADNARGG